jgi:hypothetical protein
VAPHSILVEPSGCEPPSYARALRALAADRVPFLVGGALALTAYCGIRRNTKDLDLCLLRRDVPRALRVLEAAGFRTETPYPHWLAKAYALDGHFIDLIFNSGNGAAPVDSQWFEHARAARVLGIPVRVCPIEELVWSKAFVMERERFDGADVVHLLLASAGTLDWRRLLARFGDAWRVLYAHVLLFGYVFPDQAPRVPGWVTDELALRATRDARAPSEHLCRGTLLSREQYLPDVARGWRDARLPPSGTMSAEAVAIWTDAIAAR